MTPDVTRPRRVAVVGAGAAGLAAVQALRLEGFDGALTLVGDEAGPPYDRPPLSKQLLSGEWRPDRLALRTAAEIAALDLDLRLGVTGTRLDPRAGRLTLSDGTSVPYDGLIIATGVRARRMPGTGGLAGVHVLRTLDDALGLRDALVRGSRLVIVGAGFLGAEVAATARRHGVEVCLVEPGAVPMGRAVGRRVGEVLADLHRGHGVRLRTGVAVSRVLSTGGRATGVELQDGSVLAADTVLVAIGSTPDTGWLRDSGLHLLDGVLCDQYCAAAPGVFAAGDVARWSHPSYGRLMRVEHRTNATEQGMAAARNLLAGSGATPFAPTPYIWSDQYDRKIQIFGDPCGDQALIVEGAVAEGRFVAVYRQGDRVSGVLAMNMPGPLRRWRAAITGGPELGENARMLAGRLADATPL
ncbi:FAD-dependent oxidoreductase [Nonomuraea sp. NPDC049152]|uniref:NAD(P)/FAD-dependent oxidoreductase n=1 Tax=Nonomuraea sp. NPDC049152 TaxID=3154350 RepID=UPI0033C17ABC